MGTEILQCDLLVIGAGMAGLTAAGWAAERGARVVVVEKASGLGGSAVLSGGMLWTASSPERMRLYGGGNDDLGKVVCDNYPVALAWLRRRGLEVSKAMPVLHGYGYQVDLIGHLRGCASLVEEKGGHVVYDTTTTSLLRDSSGRVTGARTTCADGEVDVHAANTIIATGGYQGSPEMRARYIHPNAAGMLLRSNLASTGEGLELGRAAGGEVAGVNPGFYGHLVSQCAAWGSETRLYTMLSQYHSDHTLLLNEDGHRFCDESFGDHANTYQTVLQKNGRALCFWDACVQAEHATQPIVPIAAPMDRMAVAVEYGGQGVASASLEQVAAFAVANGFNGAQVLDSIAAYNRQCLHGWETLSPRRAEHCVPLDVAPYYAMVVYPAITFTFGGLTINAKAQVLRPDGTPIEGLLAAGSDAGAAFGTGYAGGLALAMTFGIEAARSAGWSAPVHADQ